MNIRSELKRTANFTLVLLVVLSLILLLQVLLFQFPLDGNLLLPAYVFNGCFAVVSYFVLVFLSRVNPRITGFVFMGGSAFKFLIFFSAFYPTYYADGAIERMEFMSFFVPYALCLIAELWFFIKN